MSPICLFTLLLSCVCGVISKHPVWPTARKTFFFGFLEEFYVQVFDVLVVKKGTAELAWNPSHERKGVILDSPFYSVGGCPAQELSIPSQPQVRGVSFCIARHRLCEASDLHLHLAKKFASALDLGATHWDNPHLKPYSLPYLLKNILSKLLCVSQRLPERGR